MGERIFIGVAWPYANGSLHLGQVAGAYLPPDIFARYHRMKGNQVLMVSGSDQHGTPITLRAEREGVEPGAIATRYHQEFIESWQKLGISFDLFTSTGTANHTRAVQEIFLTLLDNGYIYRGIVSQPFCPRCQRFLTDRYIGGTCPYCQSEKARGDQCDDCGKPLNAAELVQPRCSFCGEAPEFRDSEHFFLKLSAFQNRLLEWVKKKDYWRQNVRNFTLSYLEGGLNDRAITRDIEWGVPLPLPGFEGKRIYVWFEAVIGYLSATKEWAQLGGNEEKWRDFWQGDEAKGYYFIGKDNIAFHTIIWPAMLMGCGNLNLPYDVPANEFLTIEGKKLSTSRNWAVWLPDYLSRYDPDPLRYLLSVSMPETNDTDFSWSELIRRNNDELVATYGNLVHRVLTFTYRKFDGCVPEPGELDDTSNNMMREAEITIGKVEELISECHFKEAVKSAMSLAQEANRYLDMKSPWKVIKDDRQAAATALYVATTVISCLRTVLYPFLPFSSQKLHEYLGFTGSVGDDGWRLHVPAPGQKLLPPEALFSKLDEELAEEESNRLRQSSASQ
ncbi:MAG: methionine--tRNA ligase [Dehalococcoidales bacterium]|nr:methionine--tRNA ligase [Dehalococcoidales bacterium]